MFKLRSALAAIFACALLIAGCGGSTMQKSHSAAPGHPCAPSDFYMQCALPAPSVGLAPRTLGPSTYGVDFGWSGVSAARAKALGARFGASYFSADASKNWTAATVAAYHRLGLATVGVWETYATRAEAGPIAGAQDAQAAKAQAAAVGNTTRPILFAIDCDCAASQILGYFRGVHSVLGSRADAYGGYSQIWAVYHAGLVGNENWQTYAWSGGGWLSPLIAPLEQYLNGNAFDNDRALRPAYGQWPYSAPKPVPASLPVCIHHRLSKSACAAVKRQIASDQRAVTASRQAWGLTVVDLAAHRCVRPFRRAVCRQGGHDVRVFSGRVAYFAAVMARTEAVS